MRKVLKKVFTAVGRFFGGLINIWSQCGLYLYLVITTVLILRAYPMDSFALQLIFCIAVPLFLGMVFPGIVLALLNSERLFEVTKRKVIVAYIIVETLISVILLVQFPKVSIYMAPIILVWYIATLNFKGWLNDTYNGYEIKGLKKMYQVIPHISALLLFILPIIGVVYLYVTEVGLNVGQKVFFSTILIIASVWMNTDEDFSIEKILLYDESNQKKKYF